MKRKVSILVKVMLVLCVLFSASVASDLYAKDVEVISAPVCQSANEIISYWTPERMRDAIPIDLIIKEGSMSDIGIEEIEPIEEEKLEPMEVESISPESPYLGGAETCDEDEESGDYGIMGPLVEMLSYPRCPYTLYDVRPASQYQIFPFRAVGKLFMTFYGADYVGSAAVGYRNMVWTAGHCVHWGNGSGGGWATNVMFHPNYRYGTSSDGIWVADNLWTLNGWYNNSDVRYDTGVIICKRKSNKRISQQTGSLGVMFNRPKKLHWHAMGYPKETPFGGNRQWITAAQYCGVDIIRRSPRPIGIGCNMTGGCSGGPWIYALRPGLSGRNNYINGNNSYRYSSRVLYSPYWSTGQKNLYIACKGIESANE